MFGRSDLLHCAAITGCLAICLASSAADAAAVDYLDLQPEELLNVEITSVSRRPEKLSETPAAAYIITRDDILRAGVTTIPDALRLAPGVQVAQQDGNSWAVSIRGMNNGLANKLLVMIDGRTVYNPLFGGVYWEAQDVLFHDIDRIEVIRGPGGTMWGANAVNGVINIITRHTRETTGSMVNAAYGTHENPVIGARHGGTFGPEKTYRVYAKTFGRDHNLRTNGDPAVDEWDSMRGGFRMDWNDSFTLQGDAYRINAEQRNSIPIFDAPFSMIRDVDVEYKGANLLGHWEKNFDDGAALTMQSYLDYTRRDEQLFLNDQRVIFDIESQYNFADIGRHSVVTGAGYRYMTEDEEGTRVVFFNPPSQSDNIFSAFVQDKIMLSPDRLYLTLGSKFEHNEYSGLEIQPNARLQWHPGTDQTVWASVSRAVRTPTRLEHSTRFRLQNSAGPSQLALVGNDEYDSEELIAYELGYRTQITHALSFDAATFYNDYDDLGSLALGTPFIENNGIDPVNTLTPVFFNNDVKGETYGFELFAKWDISPSWTLSGTYSFIDIQLHDKNPGIVNNEAAEDVDPRHQANLRASWKIRDNLSLDTTAWYIDETPQGDISDYLRLDMNLGWKIDDNVKFNLVGQNLLEEGHRELGGAGNVRATEIERAFYGKVTWEF